MSTERGHALRWVCPECRTSHRVEALDPDVARAALVSVIREHLDAFHDAPDVNAVAQSSWLSPAGHLAELWGGPHDGERVWCPPGDLPDVIGLHRDDQGRLTPVRSAAARLLPHVVTYRLDLDHPGTRYRHEGRPR